MEVEQGFSWHIADEMPTTRTQCRRGYCGTSPCSAAATENFLTHLVKSPFKTYIESKSLVNSTHRDSCIESGHFKRAKTRKVNGLGKMDTSRRKASNYTEMAYREAVSKLKYLLAETYSPRVLTRYPYRNGNLRVNESGDDADDGSIASESFKGKSLTTSKSKCFLSRPRGTRLKKTSGNNLPTNRENRDSPTELTSYIERQEEYIEQLEKESRYCKDELASLLGKVREVIAENEALHDKNKNLFAKAIVNEYESSSAEEEGCKTEVNDLSKERKTRRMSSQRALEGPSIVFESRISELEAQLTQAKIELKKCQEENQANLQKLSEECGKINPDMALRLEQALRDKRETEKKLEELQNNFASLREREADLSLRTKRAMDVAQEAEFEKARAQEEIRRLVEELDRRNEKLREACQEANRRVVEEKQQVERRYNQQVEQLSADVACQWEAANKSQLESERQRRMIVELKRELALKQTTIDDLRKELQNKVSALQGDLNRALSEKDAAEEEVTSAKSLTERIERQARQEQNRLQIEINSYKQRLERADSDLVHCRRENLRLAEQIASLEKEINLNKIAEEARTSTSVSKPGSEKEIASLIIDMDSKHAATVAALEDTLSNQATLVSQLTAKCQSLTQRLEDNDLEHKQEMAKLQDNIRSLSNQIQKTLENRKDCGSELESRKNEKLSNEGDQTESSHIDNNSQGHESTETLDKTANSKSQLESNEGNEQERANSSKTKESNVNEDCQERDTEVSQNQRAPDDQNYEHNFGEYNRYDPSEYQQYYQEGQYDESGGYIQERYNEREYSNYIQDENEECTESRTNEKS